MNTHYVTTKNKGDFMNLRKNVPRLKTTIVNFIGSNLREYILIGVLFIIGIFVGVIIINNCNEIQGQEINNYILKFIEKFKSMDNIDKSSLIINSIKNNLILSIIIWLAGTTVIGVPIVFTTILYRGVCLGYTISAISYTLGGFKGCLFCIISLCAQNILFIPALLSLGVSSIKLYKSIMKDRQKNNIKIEIIRHTIFSGLMLIILILSSFVENIFSVSILQNMIKFF